jgi:DNA transformation protein and related proteins
LDADAIRELFEPFGQVGLRRMFGGKGIYADGLIFGIETGGTIFLKADDVNRPGLEAAGSRIFTFAKKDGTATLTSYWSMPDTCFDDEEELKAQSQAALAAARRSAAAKPRKVSKRKRRT